MQIHNKRIIAEKLIMLVPMCLFLSNFALFTFMGQKIRPLEVVVPIVYLIVYSRALYLKQMFLVILLLPLFGFINAVDKTSFMTSYIFYALEVFVLYSALGNSKSVSIERKEKIICFIFRLFVFCTIWGILQFVLANVLGNMVLYNCFGIWQYHPHYENTLSGIIRATSIFYEPSVYGWMSVFVFVLNRYVKITKYYKTILMCSIISVAIAFSASAIIGLVAVFILDISVEKNTNNKVIGMLIIFVLAIGMFFSGVNVGNILRLNTINLEGSSGYNRVVYPIIASVQTLSVYPVFGRGLGQIGIQDPLIENYSYIFNSIFGMVVTFGLSSIIIFLQIIGLFKRWMRIDKKTIVFIVLILYLLISNGSFLTLEYPVIVIMLQYAIEYKVENKSSLGLI